MAARENIAYLGHPKVEELRYGWGKEIAEEEKRSLLSNRDRSQENGAMGQMQSSNRNSNSQSNRGNNNNGNFTHRDGDRDDRSHSNYSHLSERDNRRPEPSSLTKVRNISISYPAPLVPFIIYITRALFPLPP